MAARGPFADDAALALADLARGRDPEARAEWLLVRRPGAPGFMRGVEEALTIFRRIGASARGAALIEATLGQALNPELRTSLLVKAAEAHLDAGAAERARTLLLRHYWARRDALPEPLLDALRRLEATPDLETELMREALHGARAACEGVAARLLEIPATSGPPSARRLAASALGLRWRDPAAALALLDAGLAVDTEPFETGLARAMVLRRLERDAEAANLLLALIEREPNHLLAAEARDQASVVLRRLERFAEADAMDEDLLALADAGPFHRDALWRLGFGAVLRTERSLSERWLRELEGRYGPEPDRHSFTWAERARYWRATTAGSRDVTRAALSDLLARYPAGWYGLLARHRLGRSKVERVTDEPWVIAAEDPMATALALYRLGDERASRLHLEALMSAHMLPQPGRRLLAELLVVEGDERRAERVLRFASIPSTMPGDDASQLYLDWYPMPHAEALATAAHEAKLPRHLLAGIVSVETRFNARARSAVGAIGLAQLMPATGEGLGRRVYGSSFDAASLWDPAVNLTLASVYLRDLLGRFGGHPALAAAAYNAGPVPVRRWLEARGRLGLDAWVETIPYEEARRYVMRVLADAEIYRRLYHRDEPPLTLSLALPPN